MRREMKDNNQMNDYVNDYNVNVLFCILLKWVETKKKKNNMRKSKKMFPQCQSDKRSQFSNKCFNFYNIY